MVPVGRTKAGDAFAGRLKEITDAIGPYPHAELKHSNAPPRQSTGMLKVACKACTCVVCMTRKWIDEVGAAYQAETGLRCESYLCRPGDGAGQVGALT